MTSGLRSKAPRTARVASASALVLFAALAGCAGFQHVPWVQSQRWPAPMESGKPPLPAGDASNFPPGPEEVRVLRHADPVQVRVAGSAGSIPLSYRRKEMRVVSGSGITCSEEGRAEVLFEGGTSVLLFGHCDAIVGSPSRGEASLIFRRIDHVRFDPVTEDLYELVGGAKLRARDGPIRASLARDDVLRVANESKRSAQVAYLDETIVLDPGQAVLLPILSSGSRPSAPPEGSAVVRGTGFSVERSGSAEVVPDAEALVARGARGEGDVRALGVRVHVSAGAEARFQGLGRRVEPQAPAAAEGSKSR